MRKGSRPSSFHEERHALCPLNHSLRHLEQMSHMAASLSVMLKQARAAMTIVHRMASRRSGPTFFRLAATFF